MIQLYLKYFFFSLKATNQHGVHSPYLYALVCSCFYNSSWKSIRKLPLNNQNQEFFLYDSNNVWKFLNKSKNQVKGQWSQKVFQVDDGPRYQGSGTWVHVDGKSYWESTTPAPLPRRERDIRNDYNLTIRGNRVEIMNNGWAHIQDNQKIIRTNNINNTIAKEKGYNSYRKVEDERCKYALKWWNENYKKWTIVKDVWNDIYNKKQTLKVSQLYKQKPLYMYLFVDDYETKEKIRTLIDRFVD